MREAPPPYRAEGPHALWHVSENDSIRRFEPRDFWAESETTQVAVDRFLGGDRERRVHVVEPRWLEPMRTTHVLAYRMPEAPFVENDDRFWISEEPIEPLELVELADLVERHEAAGIELRTEEDLPGFWNEVVGSSLGYSGIRLRNARMRA